MRSCAVLLTAAATVLVIGALGGCAHSLVYDEGRDKQGQEAKRAAGELKFVDSVRALEKSYAEVAKLEVEGNRSFAETLRNKELGKIARAASLRAATLAGGKSRPRGLLAVIEARLGSLGAKKRPDGAPPDARRNCGDLDCQALLDIEGSPVSLAEQQESFELSRAEFRNFLGLDFHNCAEVKEAAEPGTGKLRADYSKKLADAAGRSKVVDPNAYYQPLAETCTSMAESQQTFNNALSSDTKSEIRRALAEAEKNEKEIAALRANIVAGEARLAAAVDAFKTEEEKLTPDERIATFSARAARLHEEVATLSKGLGALGDGGAIAAAKESVTQIELVLGALAGQSADSDKLSADDRKSLAFVRALPELAAEADKLLKEAGRPRLVPFVIAREHYRLAVKGFEERLAVRMRRADAFRARSDALTRELAALANVHSLLTIGRGSWSDQSLTALNTSLKPAERASLLKALAIYWDEVFFYRAEAETWKAKAGSMRYEEGLVQSKWAALQWENVIGGVSTVLADYHAAGVKPAEIAEFIKAFGLIYIGHGVSK